MGPCWSVFDMRLTKSGFIVTSSNNFVAAQIVFSFLCTNKVLECALRNADWTTFSASGVPRISSPHRWGVLLTFFLSSGGNLLPNLLLRQARCMGFDPLKPPFPPLPFVSSRIQRGITSEVDFCNFHCSSRRCDAHFFSFLFFFAASCAFSVVCFGREALLLHTNRLLMYQCQIWKLSRQTKVPSSTFRKKGQEFIIDVIFCWPSLNVNWRMYNPV